MITVAPTTVMASPMSTIPSVTSSPSPSVPSLRRCTDRLFLSHLLHYLALVYEYVSSFFNTPTKLIQPPPASSSLSSSTLKSTSPVTTPLSSIQTSKDCSIHNKTTPATNTKSSLSLQYYKGKTLILDLDETLVHSVRLGSPDAARSVSASIKRKKIEVQNDKQSILYEVYKRPHVDFFLKTISQWYKVVIFTASMAEYADPVIDWLDQDQTVVSQRYFRQSCVVRNGNFVKDISLAESDLAKVCLVDNSPAAFEMFQDNGIPLPGWISNPKDECLLDLLPLLDALRFTADVRSILRLRSMA
ncbi:NLI interacting factor-like phosphatase-domain-containing protein [Radiomyces spectabilis]|uniref:NLI interacting factor-like phosphatase-domain-containing protein n=1 Tax=Radiomyces spectabilis TaxID=64574 RepID=UPI00221E4C56|nr:NLI interacting factor-like phosphatase-domain-containing protein [Radiomyces spectabilis]KAI8388770.1 NLI interacting factor-like phosphatase-domain-containing protein [Radiomyces spectabilis]